MFLLIRESKYNSNIVKDDYDVEMWAKDRADIEQMKNLKELESKLKGNDFRSFKIVELDS
jgi:hypothetical protein|tara:strand:+ start:444 stop:623 length:180 start_codon:yes stop_codon:yes gene_type:complete